MEREGWIGDSEKREIPLSSDDYNKRKSSLKLSFSARNGKEEYWRSYKDTKMKMVIDFTANTCLSTSIFS